MQRKAICSAAFALSILTLSPVFAKKQFLEELRDYLLLDTTKTSSSQFEDNIPDGETFDFIVVGAGTAGSVIANRLTENQANVLLLEAGEEESLLNAIPEEAQTLLATKYNWNYPTIPQENACYGMVDRVWFMAKGKAIGGTSSINGMIHTRGNRRDYDIWAELGNKGWSYDDVLPYFLKSEQSHLENADEGYHNTQGLLPVSVAAFQDPISNAFLQAAEESGHKILDYNGESQMGFSRTQGYIKNGRRVSSGTAFILPFTYRENLHILKSSMVTRILIDDTKRASGVVYVRNGKEYTAYASKEVILSAGVIGSAQLLMLSGIGPKEDLERLDITSVQDLPVGQTFYDHPLFPGLIFTHNATDETSTNLTSFLDWVNYGTGIFGTLQSQQALGFISTDHTSYPNVELMLALGYIGASDIAAADANYNRDIIDKYLKPLKNSSVFNIYTQVMHPRSVGYLKLRSNDPYDYPFVNPNYYGNPEDLDVHLSGIRFVLELTENEPFKRINAKLYKTPVPGCEQEEYNSDAYWICAMKHISKGISHSCSSCKMGPMTDPMAVVDSNLKVYGIKNLRVADASIFPMLVTGHTNAAAVMVGEKAADLIKQEWY